MCLLYDPAVILVYHSVLANTRCSISLWSWMQAELLSRLRHTGIKHVLRTVMLS